MEPGDDAAVLDASLIQNFARLDPDEVAQWETFAQLVKAGRSVTDIDAETIRNLTLVTKAQHREWLKLLEDPLL